MAPKRHHGDDDTVEVAEFSKSVYLVARVLGDKSANSVFVVDAAADAGGNLREHARHLGELSASKRGMSFVAAHSKHGSWIVAVGGSRGSTIIYDPSTLEGFRGPALSRPKHEPILISHGSKVYAISRTPSVRPGRGRDFEPWFEFLDFNKGVPCVFHGGYPEWKRLPPPPFFPCLLDPLEFRNPPEISISSYAAVGSHILFSPQQEDVGTYAFHVVEKTWEKVWDKNLPFVGQAVHLGGSLFAANSRLKSNNFVATASVFCMSINVSMSPMSPAVSHKLSVILVEQFPLASEGKITSPLFCPLGKGGFCAIGKVSFRPNQEALKTSLTSIQMDNIGPMLTACQTESVDSGDVPVGVKVEQHGRLTSFQMDNIGPMLTACQTESADSWDVPVGVKVEQHDRLISFQMDNIGLMLTACQTENADSGDVPVGVKVEQHDHICKFMVYSQDLPSPLTVVAALSMDCEHPELFEKKTTKVPRTTVSDIFEAQIIHLRT